MIDWTTIKATAKATIADVMSLDPKQIRWQDEAEGGTWMQSPALLLGIFGLGDIGHAEESREAPNATDDQVVTVTQQKRFTLSVRAESFTQKIDDVNHAGSLLETLKTRLRRSTSIARLSGVFGIAEFRPTQKINYVDESNRQVSAFVMDLSCLTVDNDTDTTPGAGGFINEARGSGTVKQTGPGNPPADTTVTFDAVGG